MPGNSSPRATKSGSPYKKFLVLTKICVSTNFSCQAIARQSKITSLFCDKKISWLRQLSGCQESSMVGTCHSLNRWLFKVGFMISFCLICSLVLLSKWVMIVYFLGLPCLKITKFNRLFMYFLDASSRAHEKAVNVSDPSLPVAEGLCSCLLWTFKILEKEATYMILDL